MFWKSTLNTRCKNHRFQFLVIKPTKTGSAVIGELFANNLPQANKVTFKAEDGGFVNGSKTEIFIFANTLVDISYAWLDPRIRYT